LHWKKMSISLQSWMHFYSFIRMAIYFYTFQSKNNIVFCVCALWILLNSKLWIGNAVLQSSESKNNIGHFCVSWILFNSLLNSKFRIGNEVVQSS